MIALKGMSWDHPRGFDPMVATAKEYSRRNPNVIIEWDFAGRKKVGKWIRIPIKRKNARKVQ